jgi:hypothetical protein
MSQSPPPPVGDVLGDLVAIVEQETAKLGNRDAWRAILARATAHGVLGGGGLGAFRDAVWQARAAARDAKRLARAATKDAAREKSLASLRRRAERQKRRGLAAAAAASNAADVLDAFQIEQGTGTL